MSSVRSHDSARQRVAPTDIVLVNWPLRDQPLASLAAAGAFVAIAYGVGRLADQTGVDFAAGIALFASTWRRLAATCGTDLGFSAARGAGSLGAMESSAPAI